MVSLSNRFISIMLLLSILVSCSPKPQETSESLIGKWEYYDAKKGYYAFQNNIEFVSDGSILIPDSPNPKTKKLEYSLLEKNSLILTAGGQSEIISYELSKDRLKLIFKDGYNLYHRNELDLANEEEKKGEGSLYGVEDLLSGSKVITPKNVNKLVELSQLGKGTLVNMAYSPDGTTIAVLTSIGIYLYESQSYVEQKFISSEKYHSEVTFTPDGTILISWGSPDDGICLWDIKTGRSLHEFEGYSSEVDSIAISPDGMTLATGSYDNTIKIWNIDSGKLLHQLQGNFDDAYNEIIHDITFSPDGKILAWGNQSGHVILWDLDKGELIYEDNCWDWGFFCTNVTFSPDGSKLFARSGTSGKEGGTLWDVKTGKILIDLYPSIENAVFIQDGKKLALSSRDGSLRLLDLDRREIIQTIKGTNFYDQVIFSPNLSAIALRGSDFVKIMDISSGAVLYEISLPSNQISDMIFSPDGKTLATLSRDESLQFWNVESGESLNILDVFDGFMGPIRNIVFSPDRQILASLIEVQDHYTICLWDIDSIKPMHLFYTNNNLFDNHLDFSQDGSILASVGEGGSIQLWDVDSGDQLRELKGDLIFGKFDFFPDGRTLAARSENIIYLWDINTGDQDQVSLEQAALSRFYIFSPDGSILTSLTNDNTIDVRDTDSGKHLLTIDKQNFGSYLAFSPDGHLLASSGLDGSINLWDPKSGNQVRVLKGGVFVSNPVFSPDGRILASVGDDGKIHLLDIDSGSQLLVFDAPNSDFGASIAFSPDGKKLAIGSDDGIIRLWGVP